MRGRNGTIRTFAVIGFQSNGLQSLVFIKQRLARLDCHGSEHTNIHRTNIVRHHKLQPVSFANQSLSIGSETNLCVWYWTRWCWKSRQWNWLRMVESRFISRWLNYSLSNTQPLEIEITRFELARNHSELSATLSPQLRRSPTHEEDLSPEMIRHMHWKKSTAGIRTLLLDELNSHNSEEPTVVS